MMMNLKDNKLPIQNNNDDTIRKQYWKLKINMHLIIDSAQS